MDNACGTDAIRTGVDGTGAGVAGAGGMDANGIGGTFGMRGMGGLPI